MIEKVNPRHPDKIADQIAGALVDYCYTLDDNPKCAFEVLLGHGNCRIIAETSVELDKKVVFETVERICEAPIATEIIRTKQDPYLALNQQEKLKAGDNGIFKGSPVTKEQTMLSDLARKIYEQYPTDGKYILDWKNNRAIICQSQADDKKLEDIARLRLGETPELTINPLGYWIGGINVDTGATNRKLGSDMGDAMTGGGLHGKDLSKADVSVNIYAHIQAQKTGQTVEISCAIGDETVDGRPYEEIVKIAKNYIDQVGGFEEFAKWGLI